MDLKAFLCVWWYGLLKAVKADYVTSSFLKAVFHKFE